MKLVASDFDGTLCRNGEVSASEKDAIALWRANGNIFCIVTGRDYESVFWVAKRFGVEYDYLICTSGGSIYDGTGRLVFEAAAPSANLAGVCALALDFGADRISIDYAGESEALDKSRFHQISVRLAENADAARFTARINEGFAELAAYQNGRNIDIAAAGVSKASGIYVLCKMLGVVKSNVICVGDNFNDIPMLLEFGGYAVSSALPEVIGQVGRTCDSLCELLK